MAVDLVVCVATELEGSLLRPHVPVLITGVGAVNAAYTLTRFLEREQAHAVIVCGIAGAYPNAFNEGELSIGSVVCAESECYGDLGAHSADGFLDMRALGFPVIEAMACGTPVVVSNRTSLPELVNSMTHQVEPDNVEALAQALISVLSAQSSDVETWRKQALQFTWERTIEQTLTVYRQLGVN